MAGTLPLQISRLWLYCGWAGVTFVVKDSSRPH